MPGAFFKKRSIQMNYEDMEIPEYYKKKDAEHMELVDAGGWVGLVTIAGLFVYGMSRLIIWLMGA